MNPNPDSSSAYNRYSPRDKVSALSIVDTCLGNFAEAARLTGIPWTTLRTWKRHQESQPLPASLPSDSPDSIPVCLESKLARLLEEKVEMLVEAITPERLAAANLPQVMGSLKLILDRLQSLRGVETAAHHLSIKLIEDDRKRLADILRRYIPDRQTLLAIAYEMDRWAEEEEQDINSNEPPHTLPKSEADSEPCSRPPSTAAGEPGTREAGGGVRALPSEAEAAAASSSPSPSEERAHAQRGSDAAARRGAGYPRSGWRGEGCAPSATSESGEISLDNLSRRQPQNPTTKPTHPRDCSAGSSHPDRSRSDRA